MQYADILNKQKRETQLSYFVYIIACPCIHSTAYVTHSVVLGIKMAEPYNLEFLKMN